MSKNNNISRRDFLKVSALGAAGAIVMPSVAVAAAAPQKPRQKDLANDTINLGFIGLGQQSMHLLNGFIGMDKVKVLAGADVYDVKRQRFERRVKKYYEDKKERIDLKLYENYQDILSRPDIDAVVIAVPDHQHAVIAIAACRAGKDVYLEKPLTFTIYEGQQVVKAVRQNNRILQVGSQQRSDPEFIHAVTLAREGALGKIHYVRAHIGAPPVPYDLPRQDVPAGLNWDKWLGPLSESIHYNERLNPSVSIDPPKNETFWADWRLYKEMGGGMTTDWGAHMFDIAQWGLGKDRSGPCEIIPPGWQQYRYLTFKYDNGVTVTTEPFKQGEWGVQFFGDKGWAYVTRGRFEASDPKWNMPAAGAGARNDMPYETRVPHMAEFIKAVRTRVDPNVPVEVGHSTCVMCTLGNIAYHLGRPVKWNPIVEKFVDDPEASALLHYKYRDGFSL